nr:unnamed protein product [Callosobruchus analis]
MQITFPEVHARGPPQYHLGYLGKSASGQIAPSTKKMLHIILYISNYLEISQIPMITREILYLLMEGVGAAVVTDKEILRFQLRSTCSISAILQGMLYVQNNGAGTYLVCSDSSPSRITP